MFTCVLYDFNSETISFTTNDKITNEMYRVEDYFVLRGLVDFFCINRQWVQYSVVMVEHECFLIFDYQLTRTTYEIHEVNRQPNGSTHIILANRETFIAYQFYIK